MKAWEGAPAVPVWNRLREELPQPWLSFQGASSSFVSQLVVGGSGLATSPRFHCPSLLPTAPGSPSPLLP